MSFKMSYQDQNYADTINCTIDVEDDKTLTQYVAAFINMTRMMGFQAGSWEKVIDELYGYCVLHVDAADTYDVYEWACDKESLGV